MIIEEIEPEYIDIGDEPDMPKKETVYPDMHKLKKKNRRNKERAYHDLVEIFESDEEVRRYQ